MSTSFYANDGDLFLNFEVWEWCKNVWYSNTAIAGYQEGKFENDVKMYGTQTESELNKVHGRFENDVKMYGTQTICLFRRWKGKFENDVKMYGTQTQVVATTTVTGLRMM